MSENDWKGGLGCIFVVIAFLLLIAGLSVIDPLIEFITRWLEAH